MNKNITATILIVLAVGVYLTFTRDKWTEVKAVQAVNDQYSEAIENANRLIRVRDEVLLKYNALSVADHDRLDKMLPNTVDNIRLIIDLNSVAGRRGVRLSNVKASASSEASAMNEAGTASYSSAEFGAIPTPILDTVTVSFGVSASYREFVAFMRDLEANLRIMDLTHLTVAAGDGGDYDFGVELKTYWLRQQ